MTDWQVFHASTRTGKTKVWQIAQDGDELIIQHGLLGGKMQETRDRPGPKGREGTSAYMDAAENCAFNVTRLIRKKTEKGYAPADGKPVKSQPKTIDFGKPLPKSFCPYKPNPEKVLTEAEHIKLFESGRARYTRKRDGECHILVHHDDMQWRIYSRRMDDVTDKFPAHVGRLFASMLPQGTVIVTEMVALARDGSDDPITLAQFSRSKPDRARDLVKRGTLHEPICYVYDLIFYDGKDLSETSYDERQALLSDTMLFGSDLIQPVEKVVVANPDNWLQLVKQARWEGLVIADGEAAPGAKMWSLNGTAPRPTGHYKLKPVATEDAIVFAAVRGSGKRRDTVGSLLLMQRRPTDGELFYCGKAGSGLTQDGGELDCDALRERCKREHIPLVDNDEPSFLHELMHANRGFVVEVSCSSRIPASNKFKFPVVKRIRDDKGRDECFAAAYNY